MVSMALPREGAPAPVVRVFGWASLFVLGAFLINNVLTVGYGFPGVLGALAGNAMAFVQLALYAIALGLAVFVVGRRSDISLRWDAQTITRFNAYLIRAAFFGVFFVGLADTFVAFLRVERMMEVVFSEAVAKSITQARDLAVYVHVPLMLLGMVIALFVRTLGFTWLALLIVAAELAIVISRFVFSYEQTFMGDLVRYWYAALFLFASAYTLIDEGHVRVDVLYAGFARRTKGKVNAFGAIMFGMTTCWVIIAMGFAGKASIINSPVLNFEVSQAGPTGLYTKYQMAAFIGFFAITMLIQFVAYLFEAVADLREEPGRVEPSEPTH